MSRSNQDGAQYTGVLWRIAQRFGCAPKSDPLDLLGLSVAKQYCDTFGIGDTVAQWPSALRLLLGLPPGCIRQIAMNTLRHLILKVTPITFSVAPPVAYKWFPRCRYRPRRKFYPGSLNWDPVPITRLGPRMIVLIAAFDLDKYVKPGPPLCKFQADGGEALY